MLNTGSCLFDWQMFPEQPVRTQSLFVTQVFSAGGGDIGAGTGADGCWLVHAVISASAIKRRMTFFITLTKHLVFLNVFFALFHKFYKSAHE